MPKTPNKEFWLDNRLQFARLLAEINAVGLSPDQYKQLSESMGLNKYQIDSLLLRADIAWEIAKMGQK